MAIDNWLKGVYEINTQQKAPSNNEYARGNF
jgi:hypothetical protein